MKNKDDVFNKIELQENEMMDNANLKLIKC